MRRRRRPRVDRKDPLAREIQEVLDDDLSHGAQLMQASYRKNALAEGTLDGYCAAATAAYFHLAEGATRDCNQCNTRIGVVAATGGSSQASRTSWISSTAAPRNPTIRTTVAEDPRVSRTAVMSESRNALRRSSTASRHAERALPSSADCAQAAPSDAGRPALHRAAAFNAGRNSGPAAAGLRSSRIAAVRPGSIGPTARGLPAAPAVDGCGTTAVDENRHVPHNRIEYQHALRGIAYLRILAGERSDRTPIGSPCWGNREIADYSPIDPDELAALRSRIEELVRKAADRLA